MAQTYRLVFVLGLLGLMGFEAIAQQSVVDADRFSATEAPPAQPTAMEEWWVQENANPPVPTPLLSVQASDDPGSKLGVFSGSRIQISGNLSLVGLAGTDRRRFDPCCRNSAAQGTPIFASYSQRRESYRFLSGSP